MIYLLLYVEFFKVGLFTIGGGLAALPFLYELADKYQWFTQADVTNMIAISQSTPGPIGINAATYFGYEMAGVLGGVIATLGVISPSLIIVLIVARFMDRFKKNRLVQDAFTGIRPAVAALITMAFWAVFELSVLNIDGFWPGWNWGQLVQPAALVLFVVSLVLMLKFKKHPVVYIAGGALVGMLIAPPGA